MVPIFVGLSTIANYNNGFIENVKILIVATTVL